MLITRVELENIKCYQAATFEFEGGVTAVCGPNGSGKTTILEAISWALFDYIPYKKEDFVRRGEKRGSVRVSFISSLDGREYTVHRDTAGAYFIHDPVTRLRLVEQKNQVGAWIKQHIGVEPSADLRALFTSAVGVPQGNFTSDFADQPYKRKLEFDRVLRVDEYQRASEELLSLVRYVEKRGAGEREDLARSEGLVANFDALKQELKANEADSARLRSAIPVAEADRNALKAEFETLDRLSREIQQKGAEAEVLRSKVDDARSRMGSLLVDLNCSKKAAEIIRQSETGYMVYKEASERLKELEAIAEQRDQLRNRLAALEQDLAISRLDLDHLREKLAAIKSDRARLDAIIPAIQQQEHLERRAAEIQTLIGELGELKARRTATEREVRSLRSEYKEVTSSIQEAEALKEAASSVSRLSDERKSAEAGLRAAQLEKSKIEERSAERDRVREELAKLDAEKRSLDEKIAAAKGLESLALSVSLIDGRERETADAIARIEARLDRDQRTLAEIKEGLCPLLGERCLNMKPDQTLDQHFKVQVDSDAERLNQLRKQRRAQQTDLERARSAHSSWLALGHLVTQRETLEAETVALTDRLEALEAQVAGAPARDAALKDAALRLAAAEENLKTAQEARVKYEAAQSQRERLERVVQDGIEKRKLLEELAARISRSQGAAEELRTVTQELSSLGDPRGRARVLEESLAKEADLNDAIERQRLSESGLEAEVAALKIQINGFGDVDSGLTLQRRKVSESEPGYLAYIESQTAADLLNARQNAFAAASEALAADADRFQLITGEIELARSRFNRERYEEIGKLVEEATARVARLSFELSLLEERAGDLVSNIGELETVKRRISELSESGRRSEDVLETSEVIRDLLRKAGPFITEAHLGSISLEANQLYRDITGNQMATLRWDSGYEIVLEEGGYERSFLSLSGGEQMVAALAVRLALLKELSEVRIAFFDEPTTNVDELRRRNLAEQIGKVKDFDQLFVITHDDAFEGFTDHVISLGREHRDLK